MAAAWRPHSLLGGPWRRTLHRKSGELMAVPPQSEYSIETFFDAKVIWPLSPFDASECKLIAPQFVPATSSLRGHESYALRSDEHPEEEGTDVRSLMRKPPATTKWTSFLCIFWQAVRSEVRDVCWHFGPLQSAKKKPPNWPGARVLFRSAFQLMPFR